MQKRSHLMAEPHTRSRVSLVLILVAGSFLAASAGAASSFASQATDVTAASKKTVWDGVFSEAQTIRGEALYMKSCAVCHRNDLGGTASDAPPLRGRDFFIRWRGQTVADMLQEIQMLMPASNPGSLTTQTYLDIMSFLFKSNGIAAGTTELRDDSDALRQIVITEKPKT